MLLNSRTGININAVRETILPTPFLTSFCGSFDETQLTNLLLPFPSTLVPGH